MDLKQTSRHKAREVGKPGLLGELGGEDFGEALLDDLVGEALLDGVRLRKVMEVRARLLEGAQRDLVLSFAQGNAGKRWNDGLERNLYSLLGKTGAAKSVA